MIDLWFEAVFRGVREAGRLATDGQFVRARMIIGRITHILRHALVLLAVRMEVPVLPARTRAFRTAPTDSERQRQGGCFSLWSAIPLEGRHPAAAEPHAGSNPGRTWIPNAAPRLRNDGTESGNGHGWTERTFQRKLIGLRAALLNPLRYARRIARALQGTDIIFKPHIPRTIPKLDERDFWDDRVAAAEEAHFALTEYRRIRRDSA